MSVSANLKVVIKDACILFDLLDLQLLVHFYQLPLVVVTRPEVLGEIEDESQQAEIQQFIDLGKLQVDSSDVLEAALEIVDTNPGLSLTDASVLETAGRLKAEILSSDKSLRNESTRRGIAVRGMLWILEEMYQNGIITLNVMIEKLNAYSEVNKRAPKNEIDKLLNKYK